jgi:hypothetical protein
MPDTGLVVVRGSSVEKVSQPPRTLGDEVKEVIDRLGLTPQEYILSYLSRIERVRNNALRQGGRS